MIQKLKVYQVDAFTKTVFGGNPASVCVLDKWLPDPKLQQVAAEHNQPETAFIVRKDRVFEIRWFTPTCEVDLCGHATLASAYVLYNELNYSGEKIHFETINRGDLYVKKQNGMFELDFPADSPEETFMPYGLIDAFGYEPLNVLKGKDDYLVVFESEKQIINLKPDMDAVASVDARGVICTAPGTDVDFVSRFFGPQSGIDEDPVTGSAHTTLTPYWVDKLGKTKLTARQLSARKGYLEVELADTRVKISGSAVLYMKGEIML
ncbi:PhzF family phenazine biosynthesis protein [Saccharicrinis sp. FJH54]|uniref:PhzF family phenazine biosynthesis protein n=1 Tax=Saccharicrinis sp. FJH54 TaxID=3344665 RepID=UPI0035D4E023